MIVVTGGAGFIGSVLVSKLNNEGIEDIVIVDNLNKSEKWKNLVKRRFFDYIHKDAFLTMIHHDRIPFPIKAIFHMGACSSTTERDVDYLMDNNYHYSVDLARWCLEKHVRFIYASSAATYGDGSKGFSDDDEVTKELVPINIYGYSKHLFDLWVLRNGAQHKIAGLKFFNVFGPNEYHKGEMASLVFKAHNQIKERGCVRLFKSYHPEYAHGAQKRDFIYVKDCVEVLWWLFTHREINGIFNVGTGKARTWNDLIKAVFSSLGREAIIEYIDMPAEIRSQYQYFTEAKMDKLARVGCPLNFYSLEEAVYDYVVNYLNSTDPYL